MVEARTLPLTLDESATRVLHAIGRALDDKAPPIAGALMKDYQVAPW